MIQRGESLAFLQKPLPQPGGPEASGGELERDLVLEVSADPPAEVDGPHPSAPDQAFQAEGA